MTARSSAAMDLDECRHYILHVALLIANLRMSQGRLDDQHAR